MGGLLGGCYEGAGIQCYAVIYNSFSKDTTVIASNGAGGIAGYARGGNYQNIYSNAEVTARENAGRFCRTCGWLYHEQSCKPENPCGWLLFQRYSEGRT